MHITENKKNKMSKKKENYAPIHRQINELELEELREMNAKLALLKNKFYELSWSITQLEDARILNKQEIGEVTASLQLVLDKYEEQYGAGTLDLDKGVYFAEDVREE